MKKHLHKVKVCIVAHKKISVAVLILLLVIGYFGYQKLTNTSSETRYLTGVVTKGTIIASVSGTGQVSALSEIEIKAKVSGEALYLNVENGQRIGTGGLVAKLDDKDAQKSVRDAEINVESSKISLEKLRIEKSKENMDADLAQSYDDGFNTVSNVFLDMPNIVSGLNDMFFKINSTSQWNIDWYAGQVGQEDRSKTLSLQQSLTSAYGKAKSSYDVNFDKYKTTSRTSDSTSIEALILQTYNTIKLISDAIKNANNYVDFVNNSMQENNYNIPELITTHKTSLSSYTSKTNTHLGSLLNVTTSIKDYKDAFPNSDLDVRSAELSLKQKENALQDAKDKLADYFVRAPFEGTIAKVNIKKSDSVSAGTSIATLITRRQLAEISLNEVDVAKIVIGEKANLTFDAIPELTISGMVADIDAVGTISQGVVTYIAKISFDVGDSRVNPAMTVSTDIITNKKDGVLVVPNSAIKSQGGKSYVEILENNLPSKIEVQVGLSNDTQSEIISGVTEGIEIIIRTILPSTGTTTAPSIFGSSRAGTGSNVRVQAR